LLNFTSILKDPMTTITLKLPDALVERAGGAARAMQRPLEAVLAATV